MVCDRVAIMVKGKVTMHGTIDSLTKDSKRIEILIDGGVPDWAADCCDEIIGNTLVVYGDDSLKVQPIIDRLRTNNCTIVSVKPVRENLEDLFMRAVDHTDTPGAIR